jgi:EmrB/QacA subfamily drug resistance transporter
MSSSAPQSTLPRNPVPTGAPRHGDRLPAPPTLILGVILTCQLMLVLDTTIVNVALPDMARALQFSPADLSWVLNAYTLSFGGLLLLGARAGDLLGRRRTFLAGIGLFVVASFAGGLAQSGTLLVAARAGQGVGAALAAPSALALLTTMFSEGRERMRALGLYTAVSIGGSAVGLVVGGMLTQWVSWRWVLFVNVPIGIAVLVAARVVLPETQRHEGRFDLVGALTSTLGVGLLVYGFVRAATAGWSDPLTSGAFAAGVLLLAAFAVTESRVPSPITPLRLLTDRRRSGANLSRALLVAGMFGMFFFLTQFLQDVLGYSPLKTGVAFLPLTVALFAASQVSARGLTARISATTQMAGGVLLSAIGLLLLTRLSADSGYGAVLASLVLVGIGNGSAFVPLTSAALSGVAPADAGAASGLVNVMQQLGGTLGVAVLVTVFGSASRRAAEHPLPGSTAAEVADQVFVQGADRAFLASTLFLCATVAVILLAVRGPRQA